MVKKLLVICGPTAMGKTALGIRLAKEFNGEIISADSRQIYQGMDIATGKDIQGGQWVKDKKLGDHWEIGGIPIWLLDVVHPNQEFSVAHYTNLVWKIIKAVWQKGKLPILVGGTGFYIKAIIDKIPTQEIPPNWSLRKELELKPIEALFEELAELDSSRAGQMNISDRKNKRRLIRAIEVARWRVGNRLWQPPKQPQLNVLMIGLTTSLKVLYQRIDRRIEQQIKLGAEDEVKKLVSQGYLWNLPAMSAMGYREWQPYLEGKATLNEIVVRWKYDEHGYARRQMTWFKKALRQAQGKQKQIHWFDITGKEWQDEVEKKVFIWYTQDDAKKN